MSDIEIEIDGKKLTAKPNQTVIEIADEAGIYIPRFCYHKHLSVAANCRMCLVEVEKSPKALPACATPVMPGMKVFTRSQKTIDAQRAVMEFLLINHPLDCPICDQGGECELQDLSMGYGSSHSNYDECKSSVADEDLGPLIATDMTRCILCTRCVRFGDEVAGLRELGLVSRGGDVEVKTYIKDAVKSEVSGNIIDLCPVGALTSKPYRFTARAWELEQAPSIAPHDCIGTNVNVHTRYGKVMRVVSRENFAVNQTWMSDRDRFSYAGLYHHDRVEVPLAKINGKWQAVEWQNALEMLSAGLRDVITQHGSDHLAALASPNSTVEEFYLLQKIIRGLGSDHIDHRLREIDTRDQAAMPAFPGMPMPITELNQADAVLLIGSNLLKEQPIAGVLVRQAWRNGAVVCAINSVDYRYNFKLSAKKIVAPHLIPDALKALLENGSDEILAAFQGKQKVTIILGAQALHHPQASLIRYYAQKIAEKTNGKICFMTDGANSAGGWLAGAIPHRHADGANASGMNAYEMLKNPRKGYVLLNVEPEFDCANASAAKHALQQASFVVALSMYRNPTIDEHAHLILPIAAFTETSGTFVNAAGEWQHFAGVAKSYQSSRPAWKVLRVLGNFLHLDGFDYESSEEIRNEVKALVEKRTPMAARFSEPAKLERKGTLSRIGEVPIYAGDSLVRRAKPLQTEQRIMEGDVDVVRIHPETAAKFEVTDGMSVVVKQHDHEAILRAVFDDRIAQNAIWVAGGVEATTGLGDLMGEVSITPEMYKRS